MEAIALYDYEAQQEGQLSIKKGDTITNVKKVCSEYLPWTMQINKLCSVYESDRWWL